MKKKGEKKGVNGKRSKGEIQSSKSTKPLIKLSSKSKKLTPATSTESIDFHKIEAKWQGEWEKAKCFEANVDKKKEKFFINFPYPYVNAYLHLGHGFSATRVDVMARFKRMSGYNVLFPQAWHCTGTPITAAAQRVKEKEPKQIAILTDMGIPSKEVSKFSDPVYWTKVFPKAAEEDFRKLGASVDWRRSFITTYLNPQYDKFIAWQFNTLRKKGYIDKGKHPVVWCPKDNMAVGDHDRVEGEGETPQEYTLLKFKFDDSYLVAATLRPETIYGETNFWVNPSIEYAKAKVNGENWIISMNCIEKLKLQDKKVEVIGKVSGKGLIGKHCIAPLINKKLMILPATFCDPAVGTGLVTSVPSDAPYDYIALTELQDSKDIDKKYKLTVDQMEEIEDIEIIPIIKTQKYGDRAALKVVEDNRITSQKDEKLEKLTQAVYKEGFHNGIMLDMCGKYSGMKVIEAKEKIKEELIKKGLADVFYELSGKVVCRCLTHAVVKIVSDQWFLKYGDKKWKDLTRKALGKMRLYPETVRQQFDYVLGWLNDWACTHREGMGSVLPWDKSWIIESLSDSTIYMAYYTFAHIIKGVPVEKLNDGFFEYLFFEKGKKPDVKEIEEIKKEFEYWYPFDVRSSGKDLVQNHMSFCLFNHTAIFPEKYWPKGFAVNGWLLVNGEKMSKSKGNFFTIRQGIEKYSADIVRATLMLGGEGMEDPNFDMGNAGSISGKFEFLHNFAVNNYNNGTSKKTSADDWLESSINKIVKDVTASMEQTLFRTAFEKAFFGVINALKWYAKRTKPNKEIINNAIETQIKLIAPFVPHLAEEIWHKIGKKTLVSLEKWPAVDEKKINEKAEENEKTLEKTLEDINHILKIVNKTPEKIYLYALPKELALFEEANDFFSREMKAKVFIYSVADKGKYDPQNKASKAKPGKPAIYVE